MSAGTRSRLGMFGLLAGAVALVLGPTLAATARASNETPLQRGLAYYRGKQLIVVAQGAPGTGSDETARLYAQYLSIYLHADANVENITLGNGLAAADYIAHAPPNGLTMGSIQLLPALEYQLTDAPGYNFNLAREIFVVGAAGPDMFLCAASSTGISSFAQLETVPTSRASALTFLSPSSGASYAASKLLLLAFGFKEPLISAYPGDAQLVQGFIRGDGQLLFAPSPNIGSLVTSHRCNLLAETERLPPANAYYAVQTATPQLSTLAKRFAARTRSEKEGVADLLTAISLFGGVIFTASGAPPYVVTALRSVYVKMLKNPGFTSAEAAFGNSIGYTTGDQTKAIYLHALATFGQAIRIAGITV